MIFRASDSMARILPEVLCAINNVALAPKVVDSVRDALSVDVLLSTSPEIFTLFHAEGVLDAGLEHFAGLLAENWVLLVVRLKVLLPGVLDEACHNF